MFIPANPTISLLGRNPSTIDIAGSFPFEISCIYPGARTALQSVLEKRTGGKTVWIPAFMCRSLLKPIQSCNLKIEYYDLDHRFMPQVSNLKFSAGDYLLVVHFFGILRELEGIKALCAKYNLILIEDCAHILPDADATCFAGMSGDISIFSFRKLLAVTCGGLVIEKSQSCTDNLLSFPRVHSGVKKKALMMAERLAFISGINILRVKNALRSLFGNTDSSAFSGGLEATQYCTESRVAGNTSNPYLKSALSRRKENYNYLSGLIKNTDGILVLFPGLPAGSCPQFFPILVNDRKEVFDKLIRLGIEAIIWPGQEGVSVPVDNYPQTKIFNENLLLLPVNHSLTRKHMEYIAEGLNKAAFTGAGRKN
ncbi:MAG: hypothetical protein FJZ09_02690 [Candidatus Omnitrophica bacterium]|nr:hypothetical protein [Candidatus Omnitrophota bacterium]